MGLDLLALGAILENAIPESIRDIAATNLPAAETALASEFQNGNKPTWWTDLPPAAQSHLKTMGAASTDMADVIGSAIATSAPKNTPATATEAAIQKATQQKETQKATPSATLSTSGAGSSETQIFTPAGAAAIPGSTTLATTTRNRASSTASASPAADSVVPTLINPQAAAQKGAEWDGNYISYYMTDATTPNPGIIAGVSVGVLAVICLASFFLLFRWRRGIWKRNEIKMRTAQWYDNRKGELGEKFERKKLRKEMRKLEGFGE